MPSHPRAFLLVAACASVVALAGSTMSLAQSPAAPTDIAQPLRSLSAAPRVQLTTLGKSGQGRDIPMLVLGAVEKRDKNPAVLLVAGIHGDHWVGSDVALGVARQLADKHGDLLEHTTVYIVPRLNIDAAHAHSQRNAPRMSRPRTLTPVDADRDRRTGEDPPEDLNNDGVVSMMRVKNPPPHLRATHIIDPDNPSLMREPDAAKGERADHALLLEGIDNDGDGRFNEDGVGGAGGGGVDLDMNFPHLWPEYADGAGAYQLSEPEALALATFVLERDRIEAVVVFGPHDTLVTLPVSGRMDRTNRAPLGIEDADKTHFEKLSDAFKKITGMTAAGAAKDNKGAFHSWAYAQAGTWAVSTPVWVRPDLVKRDAEKKDDAQGDAPPPAARDAQPAAPEGPSDAELRALVAEYTSATEERQAEMMRQYATMPPSVQARLMAMAQGQEPPPQARPAQPARAGRPAGAAAPASARKDSDDAKWHALAKERAEGFLDWQPFDHPQLGRVEIGGFVPGFKLNPPPSEHARLIDEQTQFLATVIDRIPRVVFDEPVVERVGNGVYRVTVVVRNEGQLPTASAIAVKSRAKRPIVLRPEGDMKNVLAGDRVQRAATIAPGAHHRFEWLVAGDANSTLTITARGPQFDDRTIRATLRDTKEAGR
ncbi:MAG: hypothetical protein KF684_01860 [Phycisphaeraceae bacterium]|nr:hypothetical protein [Phycisphaeraceae bacterium]